MNTLTLLIALYLFLIGLALGSFSLVMVDRMKAKKDWVKGRSKCDKCKRELRIRDLVPVFSWLSSKGRCRRCGVELSKSYPLVELVVGAALFVSFVCWPVELDSFIPIAMFIVWIVAIVIMSALFIYDLRWFILPNKLVYPLIYCGLAWMVLDIAGKGLTPSLVIEYILAVLVGSGIFLVLFLVSNGKWIGDGDIRLGVAIGLFGGSWAASWLVLFIASLLGLIISFPVILKSKKNKLKLKMPFGPSLIAALFIVVLFGSRVIEWYKTDILFL